MFDRFRLSPELRQIRNFTLNCAIGAAAIGLAVELGCKLIDKGVAAFA